MAWRTMKARIRKLAHPFRVAALAIGIVTFLQISACAQAPTTILPNGIYTYAIIERGQQVSTSTLVVNRAHGELSVDEHAAPMEPSETAVRVLDPSTSQLRSYVAGVPAHQVAAVTVSGATARVRYGTSTIRVSAVPGAPFVLADVFVGLWFQLPAMLRVTKAQRLTSITLGFAAPHQALLTVSPGTSRKPQRASKDDIAITVTAEGASSTLWYDPKTFVMDEFDTPGAEIVFARTATPAP